jgi:phosphoribosylpyrophosphate synthetase
MKILMLEYLLEVQAVENQKAFEHPKVKVISVTQLFAQAVKIIHKSESYIKM